MVMLLVNVGLDYHLDSIRVCVLSEDGRELVNRNCANSWSAVADLVAQYGYPKACAVESCCGAADFAEELGQKTGWTVKLAHPGYVRRLKQSPDKSDHDDAYLLADLVRVDYLPEVWLAPEETRELRRLVRFRQQLKRACVEIKQQLRALLREQRIEAPEANPWTKAWMKWLQTTTALSAHGRWIVDRHLERLEAVKKDLAQVEERLAEATTDDPLTQQLLEQEGIGPVTAVTLRAEIGRFDRFRSGKQVARFCGLSPCNASSGKRQADAGLVRAGNRELRTVILETAHRLVRTNPRWRELKQRLKAKKPASVATAAVANRWIRWLYHQMIPKDSLNEGEAEAAATLATT
jgi:transposase